MIHFASRVACDVLGLTLTLTLGYQIFSIIMVLMNEQAHECFSREPQRSLTLYFLLFRSSQDPGRLFKREAKPRHGLTPLTEAGFS